MHLSGDSPQEGSIPHAGSPRSHLHAPTRLLLLTWVLAALASALSTWRAGDPARLLTQLGSSGPVGLPCTHWGRVSLPPGYSQPACLLPLLWRCSHCTLPVPSLPLAPSLPPLPTVCTLGTLGRGVSVLCSVPPDCPWTQLPDSPPSGAQRALLGGGNCYSLQRVRAGGMHSENFPGAVDLGQTLTNAFLGVPGGLKG